MANIELTRSHAMGMSGGRDAVENVAQKLETELGVQYEWDDDQTLLFKGQGAEGQIDVRAETVRVLIDISAFLRPMQGTLKKEAGKYLDEYLQS